MAIKTEISWSDASWSAIRVRVKPNAAEIAATKGYHSLVHIAQKMAGRVGPHCEHVSEGCRACYAEVNNHRCLPANGTGLPYDRRSRDLVDSFVDEKQLRLPLGWKRPLRIFVMNQSDLFGEWISDEQIDRVFAVMAIANHHTFQILTKRPIRMLNYLCHKDSTLRRAEVYQAAAAMSHVPAFPVWPLPNIWLGVSAEDQATADERIPTLLQTPAALRFVSYEPALGPIDFTSILWPNKGGHRVDALRRGYWNADGYVYAGPSAELGAKRGGFTNHSDMAGIDWVVAGGESGSGARPAHPDWITQARDQCVSAQVAFHFKQWGAYGAVTLDDRHGAIVPNKQREKWARIGGGTCARPDIEDFAWPMVRIGAKAAGATLDGRQWREFPQERA